MMLFEGHLEALHHVKGIRTGAMDPVIDKSMFSFDKSSSRICMNSDTIKVLAVENELWFRGKELATALGYSDTTGAVQKHVDNSDQNSITSSGAKDGGQNGCPKSHRGTLSVG